jgi:hypothetical protein
VTGVLTRTLEAHPAEEPNVAAPSIPEPNTSLQPAAPPDPGTLCARTIVNFALIDEASGHAYDLCPGSTMVGRGADLDLVVDDPSVSRLHAEITVRGEYAYITDLGCRPTAPGSTAARSVDVDCATAMC